MSTLYLRNVPDEVTERLRHLARREGVSVSAIAIRELAASTRRVENADLLAALPDLGVPVKASVEVLEVERSAQ